MILVKGRQLGIGVSPPANIIRINYHLVPNQGWHIGLLMHGLKLVLPRFADLAPISAIILAIFGIKYR